MPACDVRFISERLPTVSVASLDTPYVLFAATKVETQNIASHKQKAQIFEINNNHINIAIVARETQDFASLQGSRRHNY